MKEANENINTMKPEQDGPQFADYILKCIFLIQICLFWLKKITEIHS